MYLNIVADQMNADELRVGKDALSFTSSLLAKPLLPGTGLKQDDLITAIVALKHCRLLMYEVARVLGYQTGRMELRYSEDEIRASLRDARFFGGSSAEPSEVRISEYIYLKPAGSGTKICLMFQRVPESGYADSEIYHRSGRPGVETGLLVTVWSG